MRRTTILAILALGGSVAPLARADARALAPAGGGLPALEVRVDLAGGVVEANEARLPIGLDRARLPAEKDVVVESVAIGAGRHVVHVRIPEKGDADIAWEAILAAGPPRGLFAGTTGLVDGDPGERTGKAVQILPNGPTSFVLIGDIREDLELCGESVTLIDPVALYPGTLALRPATVQRLSAERLASAQRIVAKGKGGALDPALSRLLVSRGSSVAGSRGAELTDGDVQTVWSETRPGAGQGEFVVMAAPKDVPIAKIELAALPPGTRSANRAAPETFYIATTTELFEVALPQEAWLVPGESFEVEFPHPVATSCLAVVLGTAQPHTIAHPQVGIAEVVAYSEFDVPGATLTDVAKRLSGDRRTAAAQVLERAGPAALAAVERAYDELDAPGRALAMDVAAASERCDEAATLLARGLCDKTGEAPRKAREKLERCKGAAPVLAERLREDASTRACVAPTLAAIAPEEALEPIADVLGALPVGEKETRAALRAAFALALQSAPAGRLATLLADRRRAATARLEIMRAAQGRLAEAPAESLAVLAELLRGAPPERLRYLAIGPLEELARAGQPAAMDWVAEALVHDVEWPVRARAASAGAGLAPLEERLVVAARDPEPRVREAALRSLAGAPSAAAVRTAIALSSEDGWSFVRAQAVGLLAKASAAHDADEALSRAIHDPSSSVRAAAVLALGHHHAAAYRDAIRSLLDDPSEDADVRAAAAGALGGVCDMRSADHLTEIARLLAMPAATEDQQLVALGALAGLAALKPVDIRQRLAPLLVPGAPPLVRSAVEEAISARGACSSAK